MNTSKSMRSTGINTLEIEKDKVKTAVEKKGQYDENGIFIKKWENDSEDSKYLTAISKENSSFLGILNEKFEREGYGLNNFENGDQYLGHFSKDQRNKEGIYFWAPEKKGKVQLSECFFGNWKNNLKDKSGIYLWLEEPADNDQFDIANFDAYIGEVENDTYKRGTYLSKVGDDYYLYHGDFDPEGRKTDDDAYFYSSKNDRLFHGKISRDNFVSGYVSLFDSKSGLLKDMAHCTFAKNGSLSKMIVKEDMEKNEISEEENNITAFRNIILEVDYFGYIYSKIKEIKTFIDQNLDSTEVFDDEEKFPEMVKLLSDYKVSNIYNDIEKNALGQE